MFVEDRMEISLLYLGMFGPIDDDLVPILGFEK